MTTERWVKRYSAYFQGWCQTFGEHQKAALSDDEVKWLFTDDQVGLILRDDILRVFQRELLSLGGREPVMSIAPTYVQTGDLVLSTVEEHHKPATDRFRSLLRAPATLHLYLTYHLLYPPGTRIVTFSRRMPMGIIYKEIEPLRVLLVR